jgi:AraC-like DNA-binding protein
VTADYISFEKKTFTPAEQPLPLDLRRGGETFSPRLLHAGTVISGPSGEGELAPHRHAVYHIVLYTESGDFFTLNGNTHLASPGTLIVTSPPDSHCFAPMRRRGYAYTEIAFSVEGADKKLEIPMPDLLGMLFKIPVSARARPLQLGKSAAARLQNSIARLVGQYADGSQASRAAGALTLLGILLWLAENYFGRGAERHDVLPVLSPLEVAREEIELRLGEPLSVASLAKLAGLTPNHFNTAFRLRYGMPPIRLQAHLRIEKARRLLETTDARVSEIAERVGFSDIYQFSKTFKRLTGLSPLCYRRKSKSPAER